MPETQGGEAGKASPVGTKHNLRNYLFLLRKQGEKFPPEGEKSEATSTPGSSDTGGSSCLYCRSQQGSVPGKFQGFNCLPAEQLVRWHQHESRSRNPSFPGCVTSISREETLKGTEGDSSRGLRVGVTTTRSQRKEQSLPQAAPGARGK